MLPTDDGQAVVPVTTGYFVQTAVLYCLRDHQQPWVADGQMKIKKDRKEKEMLKSFTQRALYELIALHNSYKCQQGNDGELLCG